MKNWIFDKKLPVLLILVQVMNRLSGSGRFFWKNWAVEASEVAEAVEVNEVGEVCKA